MTIEQLLAETLHSADDFAPSPDLFARVQRSIDEDGAHRRRVRLTLAWIAAGIAAAAGYVAATGRVRDGRFTMSFTALEVLVTAVMVVVVAVMGPAIRRFGEAYEREVFAGSPETGTRVLQLLDIAYYLIFGAYILMTLLFEPPVDLRPWEREFTDQLLFSAKRLGGLVLLMGLLHAVLLLALPVVGLVHSVNLRRARIDEGVGGSDPLAARLDRSISIVVWIGAAIILAGLVLAVLGGIASLGTGG